MNPHSQSSPRDALFAQDPRDGDFSFDEDVASVFPDMVGRSVPGYYRIVDGIGALTARFAQSGTHVYDLGCSWGAAAMSAASNVADKDVSIVAIDASPAMLKQARTALGRSPEGCRIKLVQGDIRETVLQPTSFVILNLTLQFLPPSSHQALLEHIASRTIEGGAVCVTEKIRFEDPDVDEHVRVLHERYKEEQGYSQTEIARKRRSLERVLHRKTLQQHADALRAAGFSRCSVWFQDLCFASILAIK